MRKKFKQLRIRFFQYFSYATLKLSCGYNWDFVSSSPPSEIEPCMHTNKILQKNPKTHTYQVHHQNHCHFHVFWKFSFSQPSSSEDDSQYGFFFLLFWSSSIFRQRETTSAKNKQHKHSKTPQIPYYLNDRIFFPDSLRRNLFTASTIGKGNPPSKPSVLFSTIIGIIFTKILL